MANYKVSRRTVLIRGAQISLLGCGVLGMAGCGNNGSDSVCADFDLLDDGEISMRKSLGYTEHSENIEQQCGNCTYYTSAAAGSCGNCSIFNGLANAAGRCDSWSGKT